MTDDRFLVKENTELLEYILQNFEKANPVLLEQIQYYHFDRQEKTEKERALSKSFTQVSNGDQEMQDPNVLRSNLYRSTMRDS